MGQALKKWKDKATSSEKGELNEIIFKLILNLPSYSGL